MTKDLDKLKGEFVFTVYEQITKQIQQIDLKTSLLISWDSVVAVLLGRELGGMIAGRGLNAFSVTAAALSVVFLACSGIFIFWTLLPRAKIAKRPGFAGLLYNGDILRLGKEPEERIQGYMNSLLGIKDVEGIYDQFINSIVLISEIQFKKNKSFLKALAFTSIAFGFLVALFAVMGIK